MLHILLAKGRGPLESIALLSRSSLSDVEVIGNVLRTDWLLSALADIASQLHVSPPPVNGMAYYLHQMQARSSTTW